MVWAREGGDSNMKMPGCVCWIYEAGPILNDNIPILQGRIQDFGKGGGGSGKLLRTKMRRFRGHARDVFPSLLSLGVPQKGGGA